MVSDGIISSESSQKNWISDIIDKYDGHEPHELSEMILARAKEISSSSPEDDLTVMAAYIG